MSVVKRSYRIMSRTGISSENVNEVATNITDSSGSPTAPPHGEISQNDAEQQGPRVVFSISNVKREPSCVQQSSSSRCDDEVEELIENDSGNEPEPKKLNINPAHKPTSGAKVTTMPLVLRNVGHYACIGCRTMVTGVELMSHQNSGCGTHKPITDAQLSDLPQKHNGQFCADCLFFVQTSKALCKHQQEAHNKDTPSQELLLQDEDEYEIFYDWVQSQGGVNFVQTKCRRSRDTSTVYKFYGCTMVSRSHRSLRALSDEDRLRLYGRMYLSCTAYVKKVPRLDGTIVVEYCKVHSHPIDDTSGGQMSVAYMSKRLFPVTDHPEPPVGRKPDPGTSYLAKGGGPPKAESYLMSQESVDNFVDESFDGPSDSSCVQSNDMTTEGSAHPTVKPAAAVVPRPARQRVRKPKEATITKRPAVLSNVESFEHPIEHVKNSLEVIFQKLADLPAEMVQQFIPILDDLSLDATDAHNKFEELRHFQPRRSLHRFRSSSNNRL